MEELARVISEALSKLGVEDENGDAPLWNSIENEEFKIMFVHKGLMKSIGYVDASVQFHEKDAREEILEGDKNEQ